MTAAGRLAIAALALVAMPAVFGCRSVLPAAPPLAAADVGAARLALTRPLPGSMAALYRLRVPSTGTLRLSVLSLAGAVRLSVSEPFGSTLMIAASAPAAGSALLDLRASCRLAGSDPTTGFGLTGLPLDRVVRLLGGRLPALGADRVELTAAGELLVTGDGWRAAVGVAPDPWRVVTVRDARPAVPVGWSLTISEHTLSLPKQLRIERADGEWAELEVVGLEWDTVTELPPLPDLPECGTE